MTHKRFAVLRGTVLIALAFAFIAAPFFNVATAQASSAVINALYAPQTAGAEMLASSAGLNITLENLPSNLYVDDDWGSKVAGEDPDGSGPATAMGFDAFASIQPAIDGAAVDATVSIFPGDYPTGISATNVDPKTGGAGGNSFIIFANKPGLTLQGVKADGTPITAVADVAARISATADAPTFGSSVLFIQADNVTVQGLQVSPKTPNKTIEAWGNNFTLRYSVVNSGVNASTVYLNEEKVIGYTIDHNTLNGGVAIASGAGSTGDRLARQVTNNTITSTIYGVGFRGINANVGWFTKMVGGAVIEGNTFSGDPYGHVYADGVYIEDQLLWDEIQAKNTFDKTVVLSNASGELANNSWDYGYVRPNLHRIASTIQSELDRALSGDTLTVSAGLFPEELTFNASNVNLVGAGANNTVIEAADSVPGFTVTFNGANSLIQGVAIRNKVATPNSMGIAWGYLAVGSQLKDSKIAGFPTGVYLASGVNGAVIENNLVTGNAHGLLIEGVLKNATIRYNDISANTQTDEYFADRPNASIRVLSAFDGTNNVIAYNALVGSSVGIDNNATGSLTAEKNWWGSKYGSADKTAGLVDADPWLCSGEDSQPNTIGFQTTATTFCTATGTRLVFKGQPTSRVSNESFADTLTLQAEDDNHNLAVSFNGNVTLTINTSKQPAKLNGTVTIPAVDGVVSFPGLSVSGLGTDFTFTADSDGLTSAISNPFDVQPLKLFVPFITKK